MQYLTSYIIHKAVVEKTGYQRVLAWFIGEVMKKLRRWVTITLFDSKQNKADRLIQSLRDRAANGHLWCSVKHTKFIQQFSDFAPGKKMHDDVLDMLSIAIVSDRMLALDDDDSIEGDYTVDERHIPPLERSLESFAP